MALTALQPRHELLEAELLETAGHLVELVGAELDEVAALLHEVERLPQARLPGVEPANDLLDPGDRRFVGALVVHQVTRASATSSWKRRRTSFAARAAFADVSALSSVSDTSA